MTPSCCQHGRTCTGISGRYRYSDRSGLTLGLHFHLSSRTKSCCAPRAAYSQNVEVLNLLPTDSRERSRTAQADAGSGRDVHISSEICRSCNFQRCTSQSLERTAGNIEAPFFSRARNRLVRPHKQSPVRSTNNSITVICDRTQRLETCTSSMPLPVFQCFGQTSCKRVVQLTPQAANGQRPFQNLRYNRLLRLPRDSKAAS